MKRWLILTLVVVALIVVIGGIKGCGVYQMVQGMKSQPAPKATVTTAKAAFEDWQPSINAVASLRAVVGADLSAEVAGIVEAVRFESGAEVQEGQLLLRLRSADEAARLESLQANAALAELNFKRDERQLKAQAISQATFDTAAANLRVAKAQVSEQQALLNKKFIRAPFAGRVGIRAVDVGQYVDAGVKMVTLQSLDPIYADFYVPQQSLAQLAEGQAVKMTLDNFPDSVFVGEISAIEPRVDVDTRNVEVRATLQNPDRRLLPGMYTQVNVEAGEKLRYLTLPQAAVTYNPYGATVFVVAPAKAGEQSGARPAEGKDVKGEGATAGREEDLRATQVVVAVGPTRGDQVAILKGLKEGDEVVTSGQLKLKNGTAVQVDNRVVPSNDPNPKPADE